MTSTVFTDFVGPPINAAWLNDVNTKTYADPQIAALSAPTGSSLVGFQQSGTGAVARTTQDKLRESVSVLDFGADPTGTSNSYSAFTAAIAYLNGIGGGELIAPNGTYRFDTAVVPCNYLTIEGVGAGVLSGTTAKGTVFVANNSVGCFTAAAVIKFNICYCAFQAAGSGVGTAYAYKQTLLTSYSERCIFQECSVWANMAGGFLGNFILTKWLDCEFGYYSTASSQFWPIYSKGNISGNQTNANMIDGCYFLNTLGSYCVYFEAGTDLFIENSRFEGCKSLTTINLRGILVSTIQGCYFENCNGVSAVSIVNYDNDTTAAQGCSAINFQGNYGSLSSNNTQIISHGGASGSVNALGNRFEGLTGKNFIVSSFYGNNAPFSSYLGNVTPGFTSIIEGAVALYNTWSPTVVSFTGTLTTVSAVGTYIKQGNQCTLNGLITVTTNGTGATALKVTNLPFTPKTTTVTRYAGAGGTTTAGTAMQVDMTNPGTPQIIFYKYDGTYPASNGSIHSFSITYETV